MIKKNQKKQTSKKSTEKNNNEGGQKASLLHRLLFMKICCFEYKCGSTDLAGALSSEVNRPKPGANVLLVVWERLIRTCSKRLYLAC